MNKRQKYTIPSMPKNFTFFIASNTAGSVKKITVSGICLVSLCVLFLMGLVVLGMVAADYRELKIGFTSEDDLQEKIAHQGNEIKTQRKQIQEQAVEINQLKSEMMKFYRFEKKIRIIANLNDPDEQNGVSGIGGPAPEDLDVTLSLTRNHSGLVREMHEQVTQLNQLSMHQIEGLDSLLNHLNKQKILLSSTPAISPVKGWITSRFGYRKSPFTGLKEFHKGLDIASRMKTPVQATADGVVAFSGSKGFMGEIVVIDHGHGMVTRYAHLSKLLKKKGNRVKRGDIIGLVGNSGRSTGPHLHYDVRLNGISVNPEKYILN
ncbi:MAG: M23 family metallopeptidase [Desulfobacterales bacterium]